MLEENYSFNCPYCSADISICIDFAGGRKQAFVYDCETCCRPIEIHLELDANGVVDFVAQKESD